MRWLVVAVAIGCGGDKRTTPSEPTLPAVDVPVARVVPPAPPPLPKPVPPPYPIAAPPGGAITKLAVTVTDDAALTIDAAGEVRLWPTLDGREPPVAVELPPAKAIALARRGTDFVAMLALAQGTLHVGLAATGRRSSVVELGPVDGVVAIDDGFVTWRGKHLEWIDAAGKVTKTSDSEPRPRPASSTVTAKGSDLVIATAAGPRYLGFAFPLGKLSADSIVHGPGARWMRLGPELSPQGELAPVLPNGEAVSAIHQIGARDWLLDVAAGVMAWTEGTSPVLVMPGVHVAGVDRETRLVHLVEKTRAAASRLARYQAATRTLEPIAFAGWGDAARLVSPSRANGASLVISSSVRDASGTTSCTIRWIRDVTNPEATSTVWTGSDAWPVSALPSGHVVINAGGYSFSLVRDGNLVDLPREAVVAPDGVRFAIREAAQQPDRSVVWSVRVAELAGKTAWTIPLPTQAPTIGAASLAWADDRHLWIAGNGLAALDASTGELLRTATGFGFELGTTPHPVSELGRPIAVDLAAGRDAPLGLAGDLRFQTLVRDVAKTSGHRLQWWGPVTLGGATRRIAQLESPEGDGTPTWGMLVELAPDRVIAIRVDAWGHSQLDVPNREPTWGHWRALEGADPEPTSSIQELEFHAKWIHMSYETVRLTIERDQVVVVAFDWLERENTGNPDRRFAETSGGRTYPRGARPKANKFKKHSMLVTVSPPSTSSDDLAAAIRATD